VFITWSASQSMNTVHQEGFRMDDGMAEMTRRALLAALRHVEG